MRERKLQYLPEAADDIRRIYQQDHRLGKLILQRLTDLRAGRLDGARLEDRVAGDLSDCRKLYIGVSGGNPTHRVVYRLLAGSIEIVEVIVVGPRDDLAVYWEALARLGRQAGTQP